MVDGSWRLTVGYPGLNKVVPPMDSAVLDMVLTIQKIQQAKGEQYSVIDFANALLYLNFRKKPIAVCLHVGRISVYIYCAPTGLPEFTNLLS